MPSMALFDGNGNFMLLRLPNKQVFSSLIQGPCGCSFLPPYGMCLVGVSFGYLLLYMTLLYHVESQIWEYYVLHAWMSPVLEATALAAVRDGINNMM